MITFVQTSIDNTIYRSKLVLDRFGVKTIALICRNIRNFSPSKHIEAARLPDLEFHLDLHQMVCIAYKTDGCKLELMSILSVNYVIIMMIADDSQLFMAFSNPYMLLKLF